MQKDYSEYVPTEQEQYQLRRRGNEFIDFEYFNNRARFNPERKTLDIQVDGKKESLWIIATYNLLFNASLMVEEGLGRAICLDGIIPTVAELPLCFRPLEPQMEAGVSVAWKKHQVLSKACQLFLDRLQRGIAESAIVEQSVMGQPC